MAPELLRKSGYRGSVDWWSLGIVMYEMMFGSRPFKGNNKLNLIKAIMKGRFPIVRGKYSNECVDFLKGLLKMNPKRRMGFEDGNHCSSVPPSNPRCSCFDDEYAESFGDNDNDDVGGEETDHCYPSTSTFRSIMEHDFFKNIDWKKLNEKKIPSPYRPNPSAFHFDMIHELNALLEEKTQFKFEKPKKSKVNVRDMESIQRLKREFKNCNLEEA